MKAVVQDALWDSDVREYLKSRAEAGLNRIHGTVALLNGSYTNEERIEFLSRYWGDGWGREILKLSRIGKCEVLERILSYFEEG